MGRGLAATAAAVALGLAGCSGAAPEPRGPEGILATITTPPPSSTPAPRPAETSTSAGPADGWYLALGDSLAAGRQPTGDQKERGYVGPVLEAVRAKSPGTRLSNLGCSGETTTSMLNSEHCTYPEGSQMAAAVAFLKANAATTRLVTLDIGANDVLDCVDNNSGRIDQACAKSNTATVAKQLPSILDKIRGVAPKVDLVVLTYYNPLLAAWTKGAGGKTAAEQSKPLIGGLNGEITKAAKAAGARVADVAGAFATSDNSGSPQPNNVARICQWTWMCSRADIHANDDGYAAMAKAVLAAR